MGDNGYVVCLFDELAVVVHGIEGVGEKCEEQRQGEGQEDLSNFRDFGANTCTLVSIFQ